MLCLGELLACAWHLPIWEIGFAFRLACVAAGVAVAVAKALRIRRRFFSAVSAFPNMLSFCFVGNSEDLEKSRQESQTRGSSSEL